jgi:hypothetical protein
MKQCKACPWRKDVTPEKDIPGGYCPVKHKSLKSTIAEPGSMRGGDIRAMACHETPVGAERVCVGWAHQQLGVGNSIGLRMQARTDVRLQNLEVVGEQHQRFEDTLPKKTRRAGRDSTASTLNASMDTRRST